jgi:ATP-binding cassette subfamily G (WHITE) protein 2 (PDR)
MASEPSPIAPNEVESLAITRTSSIETSDDEIEEVVKLGTIQTSATARERQFEPIRPGDREELHRLASTLSRTESYISTPEALKRVDTLAGIQFGDSVLDPTSPDFDVYKWARKYVLHFSRLESQLICNCLLKYIG